MRFDEQELAIRQRLKDDFAHYAAKCLTIRPKDSRPIQLVLNAAQLHIHAQAESQREKTGRVRAIVLKGRQQGCSTYIEGRFYWLTTHHRGRRAFILAHEQEASNNLFEMAQRYHDNCPQIVRPSTGAANAKELHFDALDSGYKVATAGTKAAGRSQTIQYFHGSEVAYWPFAESHASGVMQAIPDLPGTEVWLESTANGRGNYFHTQWKKAESGESDFIPIFVPWFWQPEYRKAPKDGQRLTDEEKELVRLYGLDEQQIAWRRAKIAELEMGSDFGVTAVTGEDRFRQEYPNTANEAFDAPVPGAYYAKLLQEAEADGRITDVPWERGKPVDTAWDIGKSDSTVIWFCQQVNGWNHIIDHYEMSGQDVSHYVKVCKEKPYVYRDHIWPHDGGRGDWSSAKTRAQIASELGLTPRILNQEQDVTDGINAVRRMLPTCRFDKRKCHDGIEALRHYHAEYDEARKAFRVTPYHDWSSDHADAFRYLARGLPSVSYEQPKRDRYTRRAASGGRSWASGF
jgi:hypothetical protein